MFPLVIATILASLGVEGLGAPDRPVVPLSALLEDWMDLIESMLPDPERQHDLLVGLAGWVVEAKDLEDLAVRANRFLDLHDVILALRHRRFLETGRPSYLPHPCHLAYLWPVSCQIRKAAIRDEGVSAQSGPLAPYAKKVPVFGSHPVSVFVVTSELSSSFLPEYLDIDFYSWRTFDSDSAPLFLSWDEDRLLYLAMDKGMKQERYRIIPRPSERILLPFR